MVKVEVMNMNFSTKWRERQPIKEIDRCKKIIILKIVENSHFYKKSASHV